MSTPPPPGPGYPQPGQNPSGSYPGQAQPSGYPAAPPYAGQGYPAPAYPPPSAGRPKGSPTLGIIAAVAAIAGVVIGAVLVGVSGAALGNLIADTATGAVDSQSIDEEDVLPFFFGVFAGFGVYGVLGTWGLIQGIIATVLNKGRGWGIAAIAVSVLGAIPVIIVFAVTFAGPLSTLPYSSYS